MAITEIINEVISEHFDIESGLKKIAVFLSVEISRWRVNDTLYL